MSTNPSVSEQQSTGGVLGTIPVVGGLLDAGVKLLTGPKTGAETSGLLPPHLSVVGTPGKNDWRIERNTPLFEAPITHPIGEQITGAGLTSSHASKEEAVNAFLTAVPVFEQISSRQGATILGPTPPTKWIDAFFPPGSRSYETVMSAGFSKTYPEAVEEAAFAIQGDGFEEQQSVGGGGGGGGAKSALSNVPWWGWVLGLAVGAVGFGIIGRKGKK